MTNRRKGMTYGTTKKSYKTKRSIKANTRKFIEGYLQAYGTVPSAEELPHYDLEQRGLRRQPTTGSRENTLNADSSSRSNEGTNYDGNFDYDGEGDVDTRERVKGNESYPDGEDAGNNSMDHIDNDDESSTNNDDNGAITTADDQNESDDYENDGNTDDEGSMTRQTIADDDDDFGNNNDEFLFAADDYYYSEEDDDDGDDNDDNDDDDTDNDDNNEDESTRVFNIDPGEIVTMRPNTREGVIITTVIAVALRFKLCFEALLTMLGIFKFIINESKIPTTKNALWKCLGRKEESFQTRNIYCRSCLQVIGQNKRPIIDCLCGSSGPGKPLKNIAHFINLNITEQLKRMFAIPNFVKHLRYRYDRKKRTNGMEDIFDGKLYKKLQLPGQFLNQEFNYSLTMNTDGCQVGKSSTDSAWPVLLTINELPPHARKRYMILAGIYVDRRGPDLNSYLKPIIEELEFLHHTGITWKPQDNTTVTSKFMVTTCIVDSVARYEILNMKRFGGIHGCTFCYAKGERLGSLGRVYPVKDFRERRDAEMRSQMNKATTTGIPLWGIKGNTILKSLSLFDLRKSMVVDGMHNAFLGVAKTMIELILGSPATSPWYFGGPRIRTVINQRLQTIRTPSRIARKPRSLDCYKSWKATEWRNWILYYAVPCLTGLISNEYLLLFCKLSEALHILNGDSLSEENVNRADKLINQFVKSYQILFTRDNMRYNLHILRHMIKTVKDWGPMWVHSAFIYEAFNKKIIEFLHGPTGRALQIMNKYLLNDFARCVIHDSTISDETKRKVIAIFNTGKKPPFRSNDIGQEIAEFQGFGMSVTKDPNCWQHDILTNEQQACSGKITVYKRAIIDGNLYCSRHGERDNTKSCNKYIYTVTDHFAEILSIVSFINNEGQIIDGVFVTFYESNGTLGKAKHIRKLRAHTKGFVLKNDIIAPAIIIRLDNIEYGVKLANTWETD